MPDSDPLPMNALVALLTILKFIGTTITSILGIVGITTETLDDKEIPGKKPGEKPRIKKVLTPKGKKILHWTIVSACVALLSQIGEEINSYLTGQAEEARNNTMLVNMTNQLLAATQSLAHVERMMNRFQTFTLDGTYLIPTDNRTLAPFFKE